jgi:hypothetical protein
VILVNARYARNVPGRKTDVGCGSCTPTGLLRGSFRPGAEIATLRSYPRQRQRLVECAAAHIQHMQKALMEMNRQLHHVVSDITGATGMRIIRALVAGERDPDVLAACRDVRCHSSTEAIRNALTGPVRMICRVLGVSTSGYHAWRSPPESRRSIENRDLLDDIRRIHAESHGAYGAPRIHAALRPLDRRVGRHRVWHV